MQSWVRPVFVLWHCNPGYAWRRVETFDTAEEAEQFAREGAVPGLYAVRKAGEVPARPRKGDFQIKKPYKRPTPKPRRDPLDPDPGLPVYAHPRNLRHPWSRRT